MRPECFYNLVCEILLAFHFTLQGHASFTASTLKAANQFIVAIVKTHVAVIYGQVAGEHDQVPAVHLQTVAEYVERGHSWLPKKQVLGFLLEQISPVTGAAFFRFLQDLTSFVVFFTRPRQAGFPELSSPEFCIGSVIGEGW